MSGRTARHDSNGSSESLNCCQLKIHQQRIIEKREKYKFDPTFKGPLKKRSCTDVICFFLFLAFIIVWIALGIFAFIVGDPRQVVAPRDSRNNICGYDESVKDKPFLMFFDLAKCAKTQISSFYCDTPQVCVKSCPTDNFVSEYFIQTGKLPDKSQIYCTNDTYTQDIDSVAKLKKYVDEKKCAAWYLSSRPFARRCLPGVQNHDSDIIVDIIDKGMRYNFPIPRVTGHELNNASSVIAALTTASEFGQAVVNDLAKTWPYIVIAMIIAMAISLIYIIIMRWIAGIMVWISLLGCVGLLAFCAWYTWTKYVELRDGTVSTAAGLNQWVTSSHLTQTFQEQVDNLMETKETWLAFFILTIIALVIIVPMIIFLRSRLVLAIALINEGSKSVGSSWSSLIFPIFPWILQLGIICYATAIALFLFSASVPIYRISGMSSNGSNCQCNNYSPKDGDFCIPQIFRQYCHENGQNCTTAGCYFVKQQTEQYNIYFQIINIFIFLWALFFVSGMADLILASVFATWYWTFSKNKIPFFIVFSSTARVFRYHIGTAAFGSLLLAICRWIRVMIEVVYNFLTRYESNCCLKIVKCLCACFFWCLEKFLRLITRNGYIMCAVHGKNFCSSAADAFNLMTRNVIRVVVLDRVTGFLFFLSKLMITAGMGAIAFFVFSNPNLRSQDNTLDDPRPQYYFVSIIIVCLGTYFIASIFFDVYSMAVDTLFLCFLEDCERNDGTPEKPYYMSKNLMNILGKKNKIKKP